ncbi:MAG TPA: UDP-N-acetylmuramoyl-tripeptide--D-alanyl-D-alanine ligase, partial [Patescibacteria group bacterium]|nr:UDP-N-acetylmuramoyl-tripeptide--D-alanyl-D-alanine ligase [Patescibacteria group bacterium]
KPSYDRIYRMRLIFLESFLATSAQRVIRREKPCVIAITGSVGKSSTKNVIGLMLDAGNPNARVRASEKNYNNELGLPLTILGLPAPGRSPFRWILVLVSASLFWLGWRRTGIDIFVLEMGADKPGDLEKLVKIAPPFISVVTAVTPEDEMMAPVHAANYPSIDAVAEEKATIVKATRPDGAVILNADDPRVFAMRHMSPARVYTFGQSQDADIRLAGNHIRVQDTEYGKTPIGLEINIESLNRLRKIFLPGVFGKSIAYAVCAGLAVSTLLDAGLDDSVERISISFSGLPGRTRILPGIKKTTLLDDTYNASPVAVLSALRDLAAVELNPGQRRIACLGEMRELGSQSEALHERVGEEAGRLHLDLLVACGTLAPAVESGAKKAGLESEKIKRFEDTPEAGRFLQDWIKPGDLVLAKASQGTVHDKGVRMERVIKELMEDPVHAPELLVRQEEAWKRK